MLLATLATTFASGMMLADSSQSTFAWLADAFTFPAALLSILLAHELGHFLACRKHGLDATLPLFVPGPPFPVAIGTFGAFIRIRSRIRRRGQLLDVGAAGPLGGILPAVLWTAFGLGLSHIQPLTGNELLVFGESLGFAALRRAIVGPLPPGTDVFLHPMALAGWLGLFVTSLNLLMAGQLDGGHITYALFGRRHRWISRAVFIGLVWWGVLGDAVLEPWWVVPLLVALLAWPIVLSLREGRRKLERNIFIVLVLSHIAVQVVTGVNSASSVWLVWGLMVYLVGLDHPPVSDLDRPLSSGRKLVGLVCLVVFVLTFMPLPIHVLG